MDSQSETMDRNPLSTKGHCSKARKDLEEQGLKTVLTICGTYGTSSRFPRQIFLDFFKQKSAKLANVKEYQQNPAKITASQQKSTKVSKSISPHMSA